VVHLCQHRHVNVTLKTTVSNYEYYDSSGATVGKRGSMAWMPAYIAVPNLLSKNKNKNKNKNIYFVHNIMY
jgi:hypothetical protein